MWAITQLLLTQETRTRSLCLPETHDGTRPGSFVAALPGPRGPLVLMCTWL